MSVDFAGEAELLLGDPDGESRRVATFPCHLLVRAFAIWPNALLVPRFRQPFGDMPARDGVPPRIGNDLILTVR
ncbi:hypothetical protein V1291_001902 [Nitrobacteraceae bacterium AZCC 1564]